MCTFASETSFFLSIIIIYTIFAMNNKTASLDLVEFVEKNILPEYQHFDKAHSTAHVMRVVRRSLELARATGADIDMAYVIAAYHDMGMSGPRAVHHLTSGRILASDARLKRWFTADQIKIMREAVEDHRASAAHAPRSIYGRIVAEADRDLDPDIVFTRAIQFGLDNYPQLDREGQWKRFVQHMEEKYSVNGYIKLWIPQSDNASKLKAVREVIADKAELRRVFDRIMAG